MISIIDIDSTIPNLALKKIEKYYVDKGEEVVWNNPLMATICDKVYVSCIFPENKNKCEEWEGKATIGGTGYDMRIKLPKEIEEIKPRINWGFTTRGCIRKCSFCFVPEKEGYIHIVGDIYDIWDGKSKELFIMDNNILGLPKHFLHICNQIESENIKVDFNQGLDFRLLTDESWEALNRLKHIKEIRFAFDDIKYKNVVLETLKFMKNNGLKDWQTRWYVYVSDKDSFESVYERLCILKDFKQGAYLMRDRKVIGNKVFTALAQWVNTMGAFKMDFHDVFNQSEKLKPYRKYIPMLNERIEKE